MDASDTNLQKPVNGWYIENKTKYILQKLQYDFLLVISTLFEQLISEVFPEWSITTP